STGDGAWFRQASAPAWFPPPHERFAPLSRPVVKCRPPLPPPPCTGCIGCFLPRRLPGQWEGSAQLFYARLRGTASYGSSLYGYWDTEINFNDDLGLPGHKYVGEYTARYQFRPRWAFHYSILPFETENTHLLERSFYFGGWLYPAGTMVRTKWQFVYQKVGLLFQPIVTPHAIVTVFNYWLFQDQRLRVLNEVCSSGTCRTIDRTRQMIMSGIEFQRCIRTLPNGCTFSCDNRIGLGYLDDTFVVDLQLGGQFSVPMNVGRWGYARGGYRYLDLKEDRNDQRLDTTLEGWFIEAGLIF
ncbi:MAG: hypothetical protein P8182_13315, partial [Deltaproteobacteria bacterium]